MGWRVSLVIILPVSRKTVSSIGSYGARDVLCNPESNLLPSLSHFILQLAWGGGEESVSFETVSDFNRPFLSVQFSGSVVSDSLWPRGLQHQASSVHHQLPELAQTHVHQVSDAIQPSLPLSSPSPPAFSLSQDQGLFQWVSSSHQIAKVLEHQLQHQSFNEYSGLISFRMDWLDLLAVQGTLKSLLQHHSSKASVLWHSAFFMVQLSHPYMTTGKTIALTTWTSVGKVMSLAF